MTGAEEQPREGSRLRRGLRTARRRWRTLAIVSLVILAVVAVAGIVFLETPYHGESDRLGEIHDRDDIVLERGDGTYVLRGGDVTEDTLGIVFYPGARVHPDAYVWTLAPVVAAEDVVIVIPEMPLNLAVLDSSAAADVKTTHKEIDRWAVGGHSLGGAMACRYASGADDGTLEGVVLFAAYCDDSDDLGDRGYSVLSVQGTADGVIDSDTERANRPLLGSDARIVEVEGMNHAQFGAYGDQRGDNAPEIDDEEARSELVEAVLEWIRGLE